VLVGHEHRQLARDDVAEPRSPRKPHAGIVSGPRRANRPVPSPL
jgi:hypothetical protein